MAAFAPPLGTEVLLMARTAASLVEIDGGRGHLRSASHPHEHRRFCNSGAHMASRGIPNRWLGIPGDQESASSTCQPGFRRFSRESNAPDSSHGQFVDLARHALGGLIHPLARGLVKQRLGHSGGFELLRQIGVEFVACKSLQVLLRADALQRIGTQYHLEGLTRDELDAYLTQQLKAAGVSQPLFDDTARQGMYQATKGIPRKVNKLAMTAMRLAAASKSQTVSEAILLDAAAEAML